MITKNIVFQKITSASDFIKSHSGNNNDLILLSVINVLTRYCVFLEARIKSLEDIDEKNKCINNFLNH